MFNKKEKASFISVIVNVFLSLGKVIIGFLIGSVAILADGIHSGLDVVSSMVAFWGIKVSQKQSDEKHPYGYYVAETLASLAVVVLLVLSALWIGYEGIGQILGGQGVNLTIWGFIIVIISIFANEFLARYKLKIGQAEDSLALVADAKHSRADAISSVGVLVGLFFVNYFPIADGLIAVLIAFYILYESFGLSREVVDQLIGVSDQAVEAEVKKIVKEKKIDLAGLKTRKIGSASYAELTIKLDSSLKVNEAENITMSLQKDLLEKIASLSHAVIQVASHDFSEGVIRPAIGRQIKWRGLLQAADDLGIKPKQGYRLIIPVKDGKLFNNFGAPEYLLIDKSDGKIIEKQTIKNIYYEKDKGHGMKIAKAAKADEIITSAIGQTAREKAEKEGIKISIVSENKKISELIN